MRRQVLTAIEVVPRPGLLVRWWRPYRLINAVLVRLRNPEFWYVHGLIAIATIGHYIMEGGLSQTAHGTSYIHHIPVILYTVPIVYAGLRFGWEGSLLAGAWATVLVVPNTIIWHREEFAWLVELTQMFIAMAVGVVVATLVMREERARRRAEVLAERLQRVNRMILSSQEEERLRISRDLHDGPVQSLVYLCHQLDTSADSAGDTGVATNFAAARESVEDVLAEVRRFSRDLRPSVLDDLGLKAALEYLVRSVSEEELVQARFVVRGDVQRLRAEEELALFRIAQESLRNVSRHSGASEATIELDAPAAGTLCLRITDNGCGFDPGVSMNELSVRGHLGLNGMYERARLIGARLAIQTAPKSGTAVEVTLRRDLQPGERYADEKVLSGWNRSSPSG